MQIDLDELQRLAEAATPGPWMLWTSCSWRRFGRTDQSTQVLTPTKHPIDGHPDLNAREEDLAYIAALDPGTVLALIAENVKLHALVDALTKFREDMTRIESEEQMRKAGSVQPFPFLGGSLIPPWPPELPDFLRGRAFP